MRNTVKSILICLLVLALLSSLCVTAFAGTLVIPSAVTSIEAEAFMNATSITDVYIPASVTSISNSAFSGTTPVFHIENPASFANNLNGRGTVHLTKDTAVSGTLTFSNATLIIDEGVTLTITGSLQGSSLIVKGTVINYGRTEVTNSIQTLDSGSFHASGSDSQTVIPAESYYAGLMLFAEDSAVITLSGDSSQVTPICLGESTAVIGAGETITLCFVPNRTGEYTLESTDSKDTKCSLYDAGGTELASDDDGGEGRNFMLVYELEAGRKYFYKVKFCYSSEEGEVSLLLSVAADASITSHPENQPVMLNETASFEVEASGHTLKYQWQMMLFSDNYWHNVTLNGWNTNVLSFQVSSKYDDAQFRCAVTGNDGIQVFSEAALLSVMEPLQCGESVAQIRRGGDSRYFYFVPLATKDYTLSSSGSDDTRVTLYDASFNAIAEDDDSGEGGRNFSLTHTLTANTRYIFEVRYYSAETTGTINLMMSTDNPDAQITSQPVDLTVAPNKTATFKVTATGHELQYKWQIMLNGGNTWENTTLSGCKTNTLSFTALTSHDGAYFRCAVTGNDGMTVYSDPARLSVTSDTVQYRALLISEVNFDPICNRNQGDVELMSAMLRSVRGPTGNRYSITTGRDYTPTQVKNAIASAFSGATSQDVSLFFIATHGDVSNGAGSVDAGALSTSDEDWILFQDLANWLNAVPGKIIVIVESCGSGAAIYDGNRRGSSPMTDTQFCGQLIDAFAGIDSGIMNKDSKTGELRINNKFYVLTASALQQFSWGTEDGPYNYFTKWLTEGVGTSGSIPADTRYGNSDGILVLEELYSYISAVGDSHVFYDEYGEPFYQTVQRYPVNSDYQLFKR
ncbi:MAG: leucine-rich repeat protein [Clostridia bacterium]|nr:leucine-rich repeat protein [Clostridia bacterium]